MSGRVSLYVDFDGTISLEDTTDVILERFADPAWQKVEAEWLRGNIGSRECLARQIELINASPEALDALCADISLDPHFPETVELARRHGLELTIVSDGLDRVVKKMLHRVGLDLPVLANHMEYVGDNRWRLSFPHSSPFCRSNAGNCKCIALTRDPENIRILVGDGRSDFCAAETADLVVAKGALAEHCQSKGIAYTVFGNFAGATTILADWLHSFERDRVARYSDGSVNAKPAA